MAKDSGENTGRSHKKRRVRRKDVAKDSGVVTAEAPFNLPQWLEPVLVQVGIALLCAILFVPIWLLLSAVALAGLVFACVRFLDDNESLLAGADLSRVKESAATGFRYFIPCLLILIPGFILALVFDVVLDRGVVGLERMAAPTTVARKWWDPYYWLGIPQEITTTKINLVEKGLHIRATAGAARNLLVLIKAYGWFFMAYVTLRCYFYFWSRAFVGQGGRVIMRLTKYSCKSPNINASN